MAMSESKEEGSEITRHIVRSTSPLDHTTLHSFLARTKVKLGVKRSAINVADLTIS